MHRPRRDVPPDTPFAPLVIGVVGHIAVRDEDRQVLADRSRAILQRFVDAFPSTPIHVLSSMATGADQIVAQAALAIGGRVRVIAPLPMPAAVYVRSSSFPDTPEGARARRYMEVWASQPQNEWFALPFDDLAPEGDEARWNQVKDTSALRYRAYAVAGNHVARHAHVLIALWDGSEGDKDHPSGTWEYVRLKRDGQPPDYMPRASALSVNIERGPVIHVFTPRAAGPSSPAAGTTTILLPGVKDPHPWDELRLRLSRGERLALRVRGALLGEKDPFLDRKPTEKALLAEEHVEFDEALRAARDSWRDTDDFNKALRALTPDQLNSMRKEWTELAAALPATAGQLRSRLQPVVHLRSAAGTLATHHDEKLKVSETALFLWLFVAATSLHLSGHLYDLQANRPIHHGSILLWLAGSLVLAVIVVLATWNDRVEERRIDYRGLAEGLRVRIYWGIAGIGHSVADSYLGHLRGDIAWARRVLQQTTPWPEYWRRSAGQLSEHDQLEALQFVRDRWVLAQALYYAKSAAESADNAQFHRRVGFGAAVLGWLLAIWPLLEEWLGIAVHEARRTTCDPHEIFRPWLTPEHIVSTTAGILVIVGALSIAATERAAHEDLARRYRQMLSVFRRGLRDMDAALERARAAQSTPQAREALVLPRQVVEAIGREALSEHAHWQVLKRARPFEMMVH